jgi:hypothetical protein
MTKAQTHSPKQGQQQTPQAGERRSAQPAPANLSGLVQRAQIDPRRLSAPEVTALQRMAGNRAVQRLLAPSRTSSGVDDSAQRPEPSPPIVPIQRKHKNRIQRFSEDDTKPNGHTNWDTETVQITKSSAGSVGGVFFAQDATGNQLVIKPEYSDNTDRPTTASQSQFADKALGEFGFKTPNSRILRSGDAEFQQLVGVINSARLQLKPEDEDQRDAIGTRLANAKYLKIMTSIQGESWDKKLEDAVLSQENADRFLAFLAANNYALPRNFGRLVIADASIGNDDRISYSKLWKTFGINAGNVMFSGNQMVLIDSDASIGEVTKLTGADKGAFKTPKAYDLVNTIFDNKDEYASSFAEVHIPKVFKDNRHGKKLAFDANAYYDSWLPQHRDGMIQAFKDGLQSGLAQLSLLEGDRTAMTGLKQEAQKHGQGEEQALWTTFKARSRYMLARDRGVKKNVATQGGQLYFESKMTGGQGMDLDGVSDLDPRVTTAVNAPGKRSTKLKGIKNLFGKRKASRKQANKLRTAMGKESNVKKLNILNDDGDQVSPTKNPEGFGGILTNTLFNTTRTDRSGRHVQVIKTMGIVAIEAQKKEVEIRQQTRMVNSLTNYLRSGQGTRESALARKRLQAFMDSGTLLKLETQVQHLEAAVEGGRPTLQKSAALLTYLESLITKLRSAMNTLALACTRAVAPNPSAPLTVPQVMPPLPDLPEGATD